MGRDKRVLMVNWQGEPVPLWQRQLNVLRQLWQAELLVSGPADLDYPPDVRVVQDRFENEGPLAGICSCLEAARSPLLLVLAVDLPSISPDYLVSLVQAATPGCGVVPAIENQLEPVVAVYPVEAASEALNSLQQGQRSMQIFARNLERSGLVRIRTATENEAPLFRNWNSPDDIAD
jgi:molybdenum cofactor guanylyltransferase